MFNIGDYAASVQLALKLGGMYFALLVLAVLAVRFWRRVPRLVGQARFINLFLACLVTVLAAGTGYISICHSLSLIYWDFGMKAFQESRIDPAFSLFDTSLKYRRTADALGGEGVCLLVTGHVEPGLSLLHDAQAMRHGKATPLEDFYEGLYYFYANDPIRAIPLLEQATADSKYAWEATKLFAVFQLDQGKPEEALRLMRPYSQSPITDPTHAYVMARLKLTDGKIAEAKALADKFNSAKMLPYWHHRFEQLETEIENRKP